MTPTPQCKKCNRPQPDLIAQLCNDCRILSNADAIRLIVDPESPNTSVWREPIIQRLITQMTGDEFVAWRTRQESIYLDICRLQQLYGIVSSKKRIAKSLEDSIREAEDGDSHDRQLRNAEPLRKAAEKRIKRKKSLAQLLGTDDKTAESWMNEDLDL